MAHQQLITFLFDALVISEPKLVHFSIWDFICGIVRINPIYHRWYCDVIFRTERACCLKKRWKVLYPRCIPPVSWIPISLIGSKYNSSRIGHVPLAGQAHGSGSLCVGFTVDTSSLMNTNQPTQNPPPTHIAKFYPLFLVALLGKVFWVASRITPPSSICWISASTHRQLKGEIEVRSL